MLFCYMSRPKNIWNHNSNPMKAQFLPLFNVNISQPQLNSTSTPFQLNFHSNSSQPQPQYQPQLNLNLNLNSIWLRHKSNPNLLEVKLNFDRYSQSQRFFQKFKFWCLRLSISVTKYINISSMLVSRGIMES